MFKNDNGGKKSRAAVVVPFYKQSMTASEEFSFRNTLSVLSKHDVYVICPKRLVGYISSLKIEKSLNFDIEFFSDHFFSGISGYNHLLTSVDFYHRFDVYEYLLIIQTDALVFTDQLEEWCNRSYSYIGAPWFHGHNQPKLPLSFLGVGNGGFSLRNVRDFIMVLSAHSSLPWKNAKVPLHLFESYQLVRFMLHRLLFSCHYPPFFPKINEDQFWGMVVPDCCRFFSVPSPNDAIAFAFEVAPEYLYELNGYKLPFGCHAWEKYNLQFWRNTLENTGMDLPL